MSTEERSAHLLQFVQVALQLEQLRHAWAASVLELDIDSPDNFGRFTKLYDSLVVAPMVQNLRDREVKVGGLGLLASSQLAFLPLACSMRPCPDRRLSGRRGR